MRIPFARGSNGRLPVFVAGVLLCGAGLLALSLGPDAFAGFAAIALPIAPLALYGEWRSIQIVGFGAVSFAEALYFAVALEHGPAQAAVLAAAVGLLGDFLNGKRPAVKLFNIGWALCTYTAAGWTARALGYHGLTDVSALPAVLGALAAYFVVAGALQTVAQALLRQMPARACLALQFRLMRYSVLSTLCLGCAGAVLMSNAPMLVLVLAFPIEVASALIEKDRLHRELLATQNSLIQAEKRAALGVMAAGVAHEINTPLAAILVNSHMLRDPRMALAEREQCLATVERAATRAREIVAGLLVVSRPAGTPGGSGDPAAALAESLVMLRSELEQEGVAVDGDLRGLPPVALSTGELSQVLTNLLRNALHAVRESGRRSIGVRGDRAGAEVAIAVEDRGPGIPVGSVERIWDPFFTTKKVGSGTGLGLWLCRNLIEGAGGRVAVSRTDADGTVIEVPTA